MNIVTIVIEVLLGLAFLMAGGIKLVGAKQSLQQRDHLGVAPWFWRTTGVIEVISAICLFIGIAFPVIAALGALFVAATMIGAFATHVMHRDSFSHLTAPIVLLVLALVVIAAHWPQLTSKLL